MSHPDTARAASTGIDPRGPRFTAAITAALLLVVAVLGFGGADLAAWLLLTALAALFAWGAFAGVRRHPFGLLFKRFVRPRLAPPEELEDPRPPTFAQGVGFGPQCPAMVSHAYRCGARTWSSGCSLWL